MCRWWNKLLSWFRGTPAPVSFPIDPDAVWGSGCAKRQGKEEPRQ